MVTALVQSTIEAAKKSKVQHIVCGGGVTANSRLRQVFKEKCTQEKIGLFLPPRQYATDNAAMVAGLTFYLYNNKKKVSPLSLQAKGN